MNLNDQKVVQKDMDFLYLGNLKTVTFNLALPAKGKYGSEINWSSGEERFLDTDGRVNRPLYGMGNREVLLTGTFTYGEATASKVYAVTILEQENPHQNADTYPIEVTVQGRPDKDAEVYQNAEAEIRILPGNAFYEAQERMHKYLLSMDDDSMLYHFRKASGLDTRGADSPDGWDADESKLKGHTTGHYLSALALCYRATGDEKIRDKAVYMVDELGECQRAFQNIDGIREGFLSAYSEEQFDLLEEYTPYPKIWAPYYTLHKIIAGLLDCYLYIDKKEALSIAEQMGVWTWHRLSRLPEAQLKKMWSMYIAGEFGGEAEIEKIKNVFLAILRDIKKDIDNGEQPGEAVTAAMFQAMRDALAEQKQKPLSIDDVTAMVAGQIGQLAPMDEEAADLFQKLAKKMMEQTRK